MEIALPETEEEHLSPEQIDPIERTLFKDIPRQELEQWIELYAERLRHIIESLPLPERDLVHIKAKLEEEHVPLSLAA